MLLVATIMLNKISLDARAMEGQIKKIELQRNAILILDAMTKNRNTQNPALGAACLDEEKKRVMQNEIDPKLIEKAKPIETDSVETTRLTIKAGEEKTIFQKQGRGNCITLNRAITINGKTGTIELTTCEKRVLS